MPEPGDILKVDIKFAQLQSLCRIFPLSEVQLGEKVGIAPERCVDKQLGFVDPELGVREYAVRAAAKKTCSAFTGKTHSAEMKPRRFGSGWDFFLPNRRLLRWAGWFRQAGDFLGKLVDGLLLLLELLA